MGTWREWWKARDDRAVERAMRLSAKYAMPLAVLISLLVMVDTLPPLYEGTLDAKGADFLCGWTFLVVLVGFGTGFITRGRWHALLVNFYHVLGIVVRVYGFTHREIADQMTVSEWVMDVLFIIAIVFSLWFLIRGKRRVENRDQGNGGVEIT